MKTCTKCFARLPLRFFPLINGMATAARAPKTAREGARDRPTAGLGRLAFFRYRSDGPLHRVVRISEMRLGKIPNVFGHVKVISCAPNSTGHCQIDVRLVQVLGGFNGEGHRSCERNVHALPFCQIDLPNSQYVQDIGMACELVSEVLVSHETGLSLECLDAPISEWVLGAKLLHHIERREQVRPVGQCEQRVRPLPYEKPLNCRREDRSEHRRHSAHRGPCVPIHHTSFAKHPALTDAIQHAHSLPPLSTGAHSATPLQRAENAHG